MIQYSDTNLDLNCIGVMGLDKKDFDARRSGNSNSFWDLSSSFSQFENKKKLRTFSDDTEAVFVNVGSGGDSEDFGKSCIVSDISSDNAEPNPEKDLNVSDSKENSESSDKSNQILVTNAENDDRDELEKLFLRLRERAKRNAELQISGERREKYINSEYDVTVPRFHTQNRTGVVRSYEPAHPLVRSVEVLEWPSKYSFYERFRQDAVKYFETEGTECDYAEFTSFVPQYCMMTENQKRYYLWWRTCIRKGMNIYS